MALIDLSGKRKAPFTARRMATLGFFVTLLIIVGWLHFTGAAATQGIERKDMDWNGDKQTIAWIVDGMPVPARIQQRDKGQDAIDLRVQTVR